MTENKPRDAVKGFNASKLILMLSLFILLCAEGYSGYQLHKLSSQQEDLKQDYSDFNNITFGLFSVDQWRDEVSGVVNHQVRHFKMTAVQKKELRIEIQEIMLALINKAEALLNKKPKSIGGKIKKFAVKTFVKPDKIKAQVPGFARTIIAQIDNSKNKKQLSTMALGKFSQVQKSGYIDSTITAHEMLNNKMYRKYDVSSPTEFNNKLSEKLATIRTTTYGYSFGMLGCIVAVLIFWWILRKRIELHATLFVMSLLFAFTLLAVGLSASMVEVDARIKSLDFVLLGEHVVFKNQVLFYQSKSILDVVKVLIKQPAVDSILVGFLILAFSVIFPILKLSSTGIHLLARKRIAENKVVKYFAFQSGKWSMADVIVIAILMTYIGLNGLLESQLASLNINSDQLTIITTNNTALQPGFIIFISFVLFGLTLSTILKSITPHDAH